MLHTAEVDPQGLTNDLSPYFLALPICDLGSPVTCLWVG